MADNTHTCNKMSIADLQRAKALLDIQKLQRDLGGDNASAYKIRLRLVELASEIVRFESERNGTPYNADIVTTEADKLNRFVSGVR